MKNATILLIDDSESDQIIVRRAIEDGKVRCNLIIANNGREGLDILIGSGNTSDQSMPDLVLLDINMPVMDGHETLKHIRSDDKYKHMPVVMLTTSSREQDIIESYRLGVNAYITKPVIIESFVAAICQLEEFWFDLVRLPNA